jgi:hypothetical protein
MKKLPISKIPLSQRALRMTRDFHKNSLTCLLLSIALRRKSKIITFQAEETHKDRSIHLNAYSQLKNKYKKLTEDNQAI